MRLDAWWRRLRGQPVSVAESSAGNIAPPVVGEIDEASLVTLSAWYDSVADGTVTDELQRAVAAIDDKIKQHSSPSAPDRNCRRSTREKTNSNNIDIV
jgi:uncharacterized protein YbaA (DUF1428 family)